MKCLAQGHNTKTGESRISNRSIHSLPIETLYSASSECSDVPVRSHSFVRAFASRIHKVCKQRNGQTEIETYRPSGYARMGV